jgi:hypothetical protein
LTEGQVATSDRRSRFVGADDYAAAGGVITRDLFDDENGGYFPTRRCWTSWYLASLNAKPKPSAAKAGRGRL